jgi:hypothetical protein
MTPKLLGLALALAAIFLLAPQTAMAQYSGRYMGRSDNPVGPTVSPYLNLLQSGNLNVTNYQSLVKPLIDQGNAIDRQANSLYRQGNSIRGLQQAQSLGASRSGHGTGHASYFMNFSHYYPAARR